MTPGPDDGERGLTIPVKQAASEFLAQQRVAVTRVSRSPKDHGANVVYKRLRERGYQVFPINPNADRRPPTADPGHKVMHLFGVGHMPKQV